MDYLSVIEILNFELLHTMKHNSNSIIIFLYLQLQLSLLRQCSNNAHSEYTTRYYVITYDSEITMNYPDMR